MTSALGSLLRAWIAETLTVGSWSFSAASKGGVVRGSSTSSRASAAARRLKLVSCLSSVTSAFTAAWPANAAARVWPEGDLERSLLFAGGGFPAEAPQGGGGGAFGRPGAGPSAGSRGAAKRRARPAGPRRPPPSRGRRCSGPGGRRPGRQWMVVPDLLESSDGGAAHLGILVAQAREEQSSARGWPAASRPRELCGAPRGCLISGVSAQPNHKRDTGMLILCPNGTGCLGPVHRVCPCPTGTATPPIPLLRRPARSTFGTIPLERLACQACASQSGVVNSGE